jgi:4-diphosphocytidyl-2-C-methyl-D-erythritol kinase
LSDVISVKAPAKLNLFLEIGKKLSNGYHNIESVMQSVTLYDVLRIKRSDGGISFDCSSKRLVYDGNLVIKAAKLFFEETGISPCVSMFLEKHIPVSAGLGGGSTDAAAALSALNGMFGRPLDRVSLSALGKKIGADVPFCIRRGICLARGIGDELEELDELPRCSFVIAKGGSTVSTKTAYETLDTIERECRPVSSIMNFIKSRDLHGIAKNLYNGFEIIKSFDDKIKNIMLEHHALNALMSGSGPSVFGMFENEADALAANKKLRSLGFTCFVCSPEYDIPRS